MDTQYGDLIYDLYTLVFTFLYSISTFMISFYHNKNQYFLKNKLENGYYHWVIKTHFRSLLMCIIENVIRICQFRNP